MHLVLIDLVYGILMALAGAACARYVCGRFAARSDARCGEDYRRAADVLARLHDLTTQVAIDVDQHHGQVEEISEDLSAADPHDPGLIVDVVARLIHANQQMQAKLNVTEEKLLVQAQELQTYATEARTDPLTLLANRRVFDDELSRRFSEFSRHGRTFSMIMADVDRFKGFNDRYGHPAGDRVLQGVAKLLRRKMREMDLVTRYGGEEFAVILPGTELEDACKAAMRACEAIAHSHFSDDGREFRVTASFGVAKASDCDDGAALVARVDKALYAAKEAGRNCVYVHDGQTVHPASMEKPTAPARAVGKGLTVSSPNGPQSADDANSIPEFMLGEPELDQICSMDSRDWPELANRTSFFQQVRSRTAEWKRGGPAFSVVLIELDFHDEGEGIQNQKARESARLAATRFVAENVREMDTAGHYAPGCFAMLLPTSKLADAIRVGERLRDGFSQYGVSALGGQAKPTLSVGAAQIMEQDDSTSLLRRAETALDAAERRGGNRACYHDGKRCAPVTAMLETMDYLAGETLTEPAGGPL